LIIGNKNYSSWSMRPWVLLRQAGIAFDEIRVPLFEKGTRARILQYSPAGRVPVLIAGDTTVWDSLAICETIAELHPEKNLWPADAVARSHARSICAEMHAGFQALRSRMPVNIRAALPGKGRTPEVSADIDRITSMWLACRKRFGAAGEMLFGDFTIADAFYAPVVMRFMTYAVELPAIAVRYAEAVRALPAVAEWVAGARQETEFIAEDEPYASE
jgi:glutathione S-transferase